MGSLCPAPPPLARRPASAPSPQSCFQFKRLQPAGAAPGGRDRSAERPCNFRGELTGSNTVPRCPDRRPRDRRRRPDGLARVVGAPLGRPPRRTQPGRAASSRQTPAPREQLPQNACVPSPDRCCRVVPAPLKAQLPFAERAAQEETGRASILFCVQSLRFLRAGVGPVRGGMGQRFPHQTGEISASSVWGSP